MNKLVTFIISFYVTLVIYSNAFFVKTLLVAKSSDQLFWNKLGIFLIILVLVFLLLKKYVVVENSRRVAHTLKMILLVVVTLGLIVTFFYSIIPIAPLYHFPAIFDRFFASPTALTAWLIAPLLALFI